MLLDDAMDDLKDKSSKGYLGFLIFGFYCTSKNLLVKESLLVKVRQQVKKDLVKNVVMYYETGLIKL